MFVLFKSYEEGESTLIMKVGRMRIFVQARTLYLFLDVCRIFDLWLLLTWRFAKGCVLSLILSVIRHRSHIGAIVNSKGHTTW